MRGMAMEPEAILLDLGNTLLRFSWEPAMRRMCPGSTEPVAQFVERLGSAAGYLEYEAGRVGDDEFFARLRAAMGYEGGEAELRAAYVEIFTRMPEREALVERLGERYRLAVVSNTSAAHVRYFEREYPFIRAIEQRFYSCELHELKPDRGYYEAVIAAMGVAPERMVFVDDRADNCAGAAACGLVALHVGPDEDLALRLREACVRV
jgi:putative hydrolase of the HAD superfamily